MLLLLGDYIQNGSVSVSSLGIPGYDDAVGFGGIRINGRYADLLFVNQVLYLSKGIADYVITMKPSQFLVPDTILANKSFRINSDSAAERSLSNLIQVSMSSQSLVCSLPLSSYVVSDPAGTCGV